MWMLEHWLRSSNDMDRTIEAVAVVPMHRAVRGTDGRRKYTDGANVTLSWDSLTW